MNIQERLEHGRLPIRTLWTEQQTAQLAQRVQGLRARRKRRRVALTSGALCLAGVVLGVYVWPESQPVADQAAVPNLGLDSPAEVVAQERVHRFEEGSKAVLSPAASLEVVTSSPISVVAQLQAGRASFDVTPNPGRSFRVLAGPVTVAVLGTAFSVEHLSRAADENSAAEDRVRVVVQRGLVSVQWQGQKKQLSAGMQGVFPESEPEPAEQASEATTHGTAAARPNWRKLAAERKYEQAYSAMQHSDSQPQSAAELMLAADVARLSGHPVDALAPLRQLESKFASDRRAPLAAFTSGKILMDQLGQPGRAAEAFARARRLAPGSALAEDALAREMAARSAAGQAAKANVLARQYLKRYPSGRHHGQAEKVLK